MSAASPREEAERLVVTALAAASIAARNATGFATGSAECCVCPLCRTIAAVREPDPEFAERLAASAGDVAAGLAGVLRAFASGGFGAGFAGTPSGTPSGTPWRPEPAAEPAGTPETDHGGSDVWREATTVPDTAPTPPPKPMAKKAVKRAVKESE
jgi:hypothetical protein